MLFWKYLSLHEKKKRFRFKIPCCLNYGSAIQTQHFVIYTSVSLIALEMQNVCFCLFSNEEAIDHETARGIVLFW